MATLWDFESSFLMENTQWSRQHTHPVFYYPELFKNKAFVDKYKELWEKYKGGVYSYVENCLNDLNSQCGAAFEQSQALHRQVYYGECQNTLSEQIDDVLTHLKARLDAMDGMVESLQGTEAGITGSLAGDTQHVVKRIDIYGRDFTGVTSCDLLPNIYIDKYSDGNVRIFVKK